MNNNEFLAKVTEAFKKFLTTSSRSNEKLKILHGAIANDLSERLGNDFQIQSYNIGGGKEGNIQGRYINKNVDIVILRNDNPIAGIGVKFVMQNYAQNSNNYFENMLGETANIRSNNIPYFQIFIIPEKLPYYKNDGNFSKWEIFNNHHIEKYKILSNDNEEIYIHTPTKTLLYVLKLPEIQSIINNKKNYIDYYSTLNTMEIVTSTTDYGTFGNGVVFNDYEKFIEKVKHRILSI